MALFDKLTQQQPPLPSNQTAIEKVLQAKKGRVGGQTTSSLNIAEQGVQADVQGQMRQQAAAGGLQQAALAQEAQQAQGQLALQQQAQQQKGELATAGIESQAARQQRGIASQEQMQRQDLDSGLRRKIDLMNAKASQALNNLSAEYGLNSDDIFSSFKRENVALEARRDAAQLEQLGHVLALQDKAYLDELNRIGERRKLYDKANWEKEKRSVIYGANLSRIMEDLGFRRGEDIKDRNFTEQMTKIDLDTALSMAIQAAKDANTTAMASSIISTGSKAFDTAYSKGLFDTSGVKTSEDLPDYMKTQDYTNSVDYSNMDKA
jgi:hypothetical protein